MDQTKLKNLETGKEVTPPGMSPEVAVSKLVIAYHGKQFLGTDLSGMMMQQLDPPPDIGGMTPTKLDFPQDRFRTAVVVGKVGEVESAKERFAVLKVKVDPTSPLLKDIDTATLHFEGGAVDQATKDELIKRHGWFGRLLFDDGAPGGVIDKAKVDGARLVRIMVIAMVVMGLMLVAGLASIILLAGLMMAGRIRQYPTPWRSPPNAPDSRRVWLETVTLFFAGFLLLKVIIEGLAYGVAKGSIPGLTLDKLVWFSLIGQWLLVAVLFWPRVRGLTRDQHRAEVGWHRGRGFFNEVGAGILSYLALLPFYFLLAILVAIGMILYYSLSGQKQPPIDNKVMDLAGGGPAEVVLVFLLATIWAPLVEETIFRGALYRLVRSRAGVLLAAILSATVFAVLHAYMVPQLILVGSLGFGFALMREWRGSLIPSMTAHAIHNGLVFSFVASIAPIMKG